MASVELHVRMKKKKTPAALTHTPLPNELPPSYDEALMLPDAPATPATPATRCDPFNEGPAKQSLELEPHRNDTFVFHGSTSITDAPEPLQVDSDSRARVERDDGNDSGDADATYSDDDCAFEAYDSDNEQTQPLRQDCNSVATQLVRERDGIPEAVSVTEVASSAAAAPIRSERAASLQVDVGVHSRSDAPSCSCARRSDPAVLTTTTTTTCVYDDSTYAIVSRLRTANKRLAAQLEQQTRVVAQLQSEKRQHVALVRTLRADVQMHKQALRGVQAYGRRPHSSSSSDDTSVERQRSSLGTSSQQPLLPQVVAGSTGSTTLHDGGSTRLLIRPPSRISNWTADAASDDTTQHSLSSLKAPASPRSPTHAASPLAKRPGASRQQQRTSVVSNSTNSSLALQQVVEKYEAKLAKAEQDKKELLARQSHQLANYSHELARLERQLDHAHRLALDKENELRLQKTKLLYNHSDGSSSARHDSHALPLRGLLADDFWRDLAPSPIVSSSRASAPAHTTHIGHAFEQLLAHPIVSQHDHALDASTREWLCALRSCGAQVLALHRSFQTMSCAFQRLAESSHLYALAETLGRESRALLRAEQALVFVVDAAENEFWCRVPRAAGATDMVTVRSRLMPFATAGGSSNSTAPHAIHSDGHLHQSASGIASGLASMVCHTKRPLLLDAGAALQHPCYSTARDNTDRLVAHPGASMLLLPVLHRGHVLAVVQVCGKTSVVEALGLSLALETSDAFSTEDQALLLLLAHFASGLFPTVAYFTDVASNKVHEETLLQLAPEIFTCLRFEALGKVVIENAKAILDADRCSLFVADPVARTLHNWQSDISGGAVEVVDPTKSGGMTIPYGHGIVGRVAETLASINLADAYTDPRFNASWDKKTNYRTKSMLAVPILANTTTRAPIRRVSHSDKFAAAAHDPRRPNHSHNRQRPAAAASAPAPPAAPAELLGVVQVINKSGGAPFRAKDEFLLQTITKLIALAIENSQLFQKNQELCAGLGPLIMRADLVDATIRLGAAAEDITGVECAAVYVYDHLAQEMVTFHRKRRHRIVVKEQMYRSALFGAAVASKDVVIVNDLAAAPSFNAYIDSIGGTAVRNVLFAPLIVDDPDAAIASAGTGSAMRLVGLLHLVNTRGRKVAFERHDLFVSIITSLCCSVVASILEKQVLLKQQDDTRVLLDTSMSFFKEMSPIGVINAVYNTCASIFRVDKAHLFLWEEPNRRHMWTSKLLPHADNAGSSSSSASLLASSLPPIAGPSGSTGKADGSTIPTLGAQLRRISILTDQKLKAPTTEGLLEHVLVTGAIVVVKHWIDSAEAERMRTDAAVTNQRVAAAALPRLPPHTLRSSASDERLGFVQHAVVACPVWDHYGLEIVGVLVLLFPLAHAPPRSALSNLPILCRQIAGALNVCSDLGVVTLRNRKLQSMLEQLSMKTPVRAVSLTLSARGQLVTLSQPVNVATPGFHVGELAASVHAAAALNLGVRALQMDEEGHRWGFQLSAATVHAMHSEHYSKWIGLDVHAPAAHFDKLRMDLQGVYARKESVHGELTCNDGASDADDTNGATAAALDALPRHIVLAMRKLLWDFVDNAWRVDVQRACELFDNVDPNREHRISRLHLEHVLATGGHRVQLEPRDWDLLYARFADASTDLLHVERMFEALAPRVRAVPRVAYEIAPVLDPITQTVVSVHVVFTAL